MALKSNLFSGDQRLEAAAVSDPSHVVPGNRGPFVARIQAALQILDDAEIAEAELDAELYGPTTAAAVLAYKKARKVINRAYQQNADNIVGKMTVATMDAELLANEVNPPIRRRGRGCGAENGHGEDTHFHALRDETFASGAGPVSPMLRVGLPLDQLRPKK